MHDSQTVYYPGKINIFVLEHEHDVISNVIIVISSKHPSLESSVDGY